MKSCFLDDCNVNVLLCQKLLKFMGFLCYSIYVQLEDSEILIVFGCVVWLMCVYYGSGFGRDLLSILDWFVLIARWWIGACS